MITRLIILDISILDLLFNGTIILYILSLCFRLKCLISSSVDPTGLSSFVYHTKISSFIVRVIKK